MMPDEMLALYRTAVVTYRNSEDVTVTALRCLQRPCVIGAIEFILAEGEGPNSGMYDEYTLADLLEQARQHRARYHPEAP